MLNIGITFAYVILASFIAYNSFYSSDASKWAISMIQLMWAGCYIAYFALVLHAGKITSDEVIDFRIPFQHNLTRAIASLKGKRSASLVHGMMNEFALDDSVLTELAYFSLQMQHRGPIASSGLFSFDWTLLFSVNTWIFVWFHNVNLLIIELCAV